MDVSEVERRFVELVDRVKAEGITIELERDQALIARLIPVCRSKLTVCDLRAFLASLPQLGDDAEQFAADTRAIRSGSSAMPGN